MSDLEANKALARRMLELWGTSEEDPRAFISADYVNRQEPSLLTGSNNLDLDRWLGLLSDYKSAFSDRGVEILIQIAEGDKVATRWRFHGTNTGELLGRAPSGRRAVWTGIEIDVIRYGKIEESWVDWDMHRFLQQVGHIS
ncbi:MAG: ester cyclase [Pseudomonadota bacterium]